MAKEKEKIAEPEIIKVTKKGHGGGHGGSWKVAYADFVTAMMAFFLLMWLMTMTSKEKKILLSQYFNNVSLSNVKGGLPYMESGSRNLTEKPEDIISSVSIDQEKISDQMAGGAPPASELVKSIISQLMDLADQIKVESMDEGIRIEITDTEKSRLFAPGSAQLTDTAKKLLKPVAENIKGAVTRIAIEGHTDSQQIAKGGESAWEMSAARAMAVRKELEGYGVNPFSIEKIISYGDRLLMDKSNPANVSNNRINIILLDSRKTEQKKAEAAAKAGAAPAPVPAPAAAH
ncbi:MAG: OmpA family protein [Nitrospinae bacterium]|nr:OmpA family protein [Nitrospinota bacterium]